MNFYTAIEHILLDDSQAELLTTTDGVKYSRNDIRGRVAQIANFLTSSGARPGDRISVQVHKSVENLCIYLACLQAGLVFHPLNSAYKSNELSYFLENAEPFMFVCDTENYNELQVLAKSAGIEHSYALNDQGEGSFSKAVDSQSSTFETVSCTADEIACLLYSSGTTGVPKGIMLSHNNLQSNAETLVDAWGFSANDRLLHCLPIFHVHGLFVALGCILLTGGTMRWATSFSPEYAKAFLPECSSMMGVPTYYTRLLGDPEFGRQHCENIRLFTSGSAPLLVETFTDFKARSGHVILERYGMTETGMTCSNPLEEERKPGTVGPSLPGVQTRILDDSGKKTPLGEAGNLQVKGENVFKGYWRMPEKTAEDFRDDHWFDTGDQANMDADGYISIVGRSKDMVISGGLNVYPKEVEDVINQLEGIKESAVIGVAHPDFGEAVVAIVTPVSEGSLDPEQIERHCKEKLANFKVPKHVEVIAALPRNTMGKVQKKVLRESYSELFTGK